MLLYVVLGCTKDKPSVNEVPTNIPIPTVSIDEVIKNQGYNLVNTEPLNLELEEYSNEIFSMKIPKGWTIETTGLYENFGFRLYDPKNNARQIFFYGNMSPFMKSYEGKEVWGMYISGGGYENAKLYYDAPILQPASVEEFFYKFNEYTNFATRYGINHKFSSLGELEILEKMEGNSPFGSNALDSGIIRGNFIQNGIPCEGLFSANIVDSMTSYMNNSDVGYYTVYLVMGIAGPTEEFYGIEDTLTNSLSTFQFSKSYIQQGVQNNIWETNFALDIGKTLSDTYETYNQGWYNRQKAMDALSQKRSDQTLGYERLYNTNTGETYRAENGFYDEYKSNSDVYGDLNLEILLDNDSNLWNKNLSGYIQK